MPLIFEKVKGRVDPFIFNRRKNNEKVFRRQL